MNHLVITSEALLGYLGMTYTSKSVCNIPLQHLISINKHNTFPKIKEKHKPLSTYNVEEESL